MWWWWLGLVVMMMMMLLVAVLTLVLVRIVLRQRPVSSVWTQKFRVRQDRRRRRYGRLRFGLHAHVCAQTTALRECDSMCEYGNAHR